MKLNDLYIYYHDGIIVGYEKNGNDAVLEFVDDYPESNIYKFTFKNVSINEDVEERIAFDLIDAVNYIDTGVIGIYYVEDGRTDDNKYYFRVYLTGIPKELFNYDNLGKKEINYQGEIFYGEKYYVDENPVMSFIYDDIIVEEIDRNSIIKYEEYDRYNDEYKDSLSKFNSVLDKDVIEFFKDSYALIYRKYDKDNNNLILYFENGIYLKLIDFDIELLDNDVSKEFVVKRKLGFIRNSGLIRIVDKIDNLFRLSFIISEKREVFITCSDLEVGNYDYEDLVNKVFKY